MSSGSSFAGLVGVINTITQRYTFLASQIICQIREYQRHPPWISKDWTESWMMRRENGMRKKKNISGRRNHIYKCLTDGGHSIFHKYQNAGVQRAPRSFVLHEPKETRNVTLPKWYESDRLLFVYQWPVMRGIKYLLYHCSDPHWELTWGSHVNMLCLSSYMPLPG